MIRKTLKNHLFFIVFILVSFLEFRESILAVFESSRLWIKHPETISLIAHGKFLIPYLDGLSGDHFLFYNPLSDWIRWRVQSLFSIHPVTFHSMVIAPLISIIFFSVNFYSIRLLNVSRYSAILSSLILQFGGSSKLMYFFNVNDYLHLEEFIHVPSSVLYLGNTQAWGWLFFLPTLCFLWKAIEERSIKNWVIHSFLLGLSFHFHILTFVHLVFASSCLLLFSFSIDFKKIILLFILLMGATVSVFHLNQTFLLPFFCFLWATLGWTFFIKKSVFYGIILNAFILSFVLFPFFMEKQFVLDSVFHKVGSPKIPHILTYFIFYLLIFLIYFFKKRRSIFFAILFSSLFLGYNQYWGWGNHPYRFLIHLIFAFSLGIGFILDEYSLWYRSKIRIYLIGFSFLLLLISIFSHQFLLYSGPKKRIKISNNDLVFLNKINQIPEGDWVVLPEFNYPWGIYSQSVISSTLPGKGWLPDPRYVVRYEGYQERLNVLCREIPYQYQQLTSRMKPCHTRARLSDELVQNYCNRNYLIHFGELPLDLIKKIESAGWKKEFESGKGKIWKRTKPCSLYSINISDNLSY